METEEIYMNQELKMQAAAFKDKKKGPPDCKEGADDPAYENITLTFRNRDQSKSSHSLPKNKVPVRSRPSSDPAQFSHWLHRAMMSLHILLALSCVVLLALVLMKNSELSQELLVLKREIWNVSISVRECQKEQKAGWSTIKERTNSNKELIEMVKNKVQEGNLKLRTLPTDLTNIRNELRKITEMLKTPSPKPTTK
ncbi:mast cell-expressed membrane protein 1 isoform X1 [Phacochoerus africanus]|uniref:mast cell-expressed membrane protein 1 isoform X1 n=1 Tax=Phacochoerus africanus TaxID=41426 RepID=UPI001FD964C9|nr:mast cell-expressed membrane protein 1 isoform X1 [Phacochoerus africanus]